MEEEKNDDPTFSVYVVEYAWVKEWERYVIGDSSHPQRSIDNSSFINGRRLNLRDRTGTFLS